MQMSWPEQITLQPTSAAAAPADRRVGESRDGRSMGNGHDFRDELQAAGRAGASRAADQPRGRAVRLQGDEIDLPMTCGMEKAGACELAIVPRVDLPQQEVMHGAGLGLELFAADQAMPREPELHEDPGGADLESQREVDAQLMPAIAAGEATHQPPASGSAPAAEVQANSSAQGPPPREATSEGKVPAVPADGARAEPPAQGDPQPAAPLASEKPQAMQPARLETTDPRALDVRAAPTADAPFAAEASPRANAPAQLESLQRPDLPRLTEQNLDAVVSAVRISTSNGQKQHSMMLRLDPPQLGAMRLSVEMTDGRLVATFSTSTDTAQGMLQQNLQQVRSVLEQAGFQVDRLVVQRTSIEYQPGLAQGGEGGAQGREQMQQHQRDQHRRQTLLRLWRQGSWESGVNLVA